jgi:hypothetical protein
MDSKKKAIAAERARRAVQAEKSKGITGKEVRVGRLNLADDAAALWHFFTNPLDYTDPDKKFRLFRKN